MNEACVGKFPIEETGNALEKHEVDVPLKFFHHLRKIIISEIFRV